MEQPPAQPRVKLIDTLDDLSPESKEVLERYLEKTNAEVLKIAADVDHPWRKKNTQEHTEWVTQFVKVLGMSPGLLEAWLDKDWYITSQSLIAKNDPALTEMIGIVIGTALECTYCVGWHSAASRHHGADAGDVQLVGSYNEHRDKFSEQQLAVFDYASKVAREAYKVLDEDIDNLKRWYSDAEIVELTETACHMASLSKLFTALNVEIW